MQVTKEQQTIIDAARGNGNILIEAVAGSGKTFALLKALEVIPQRSILVCAYNARIADELKARAPKPRKGWLFHIKTFHAIGRQILLAHYPHLTFDRKGTEEIINKALGGESLAYPLRRAAMQLLRQYKETEAADGISFAEPFELEQIGHTYELFDKLSVPQIQRVIEVVLRAYELSHHPESLSVVDFADMIWMPAALDLMPKSRYQAIIVDEWQDMNEPQIALVDRLCAPTNRLIMAGDGKQAINAWRGASAATVRSMMTDKRKAQVLTLTTSFRCSKAVIGEARALVPEIKAWDEAPDGTVTRVGLRDVPRMIHKHASKTIHTFILSRANAALLDTALYLWREGVRFQLNAGQELMEPLFALLEVLDLRTPDLFRKTLATWHAEQTVKLSAGDLNIELLERLDEQRDMMLSAIHYTAPTGLHKLFQSILEPGDTGVLLSSVHKVKGLEAERVFLLRQTFKRHGANKKWARADGQEEITIGRLPTEEDLNIEYVAITRAKEHLIWVDMIARETERPEAKDSSLIPEMLAGLTDEQLYEEHVKAEGEMTRLQGIGDEAGANDWVEYAKQITAEQANPKRALR